MALAIFCHVYVERMTGQLSFSVTLPKIGIIWTPREQKILFGGIIILGNAQQCKGTQTRVTQQAQGSVPLQRSQAETLSHAYLLSGPEQPVTRGARWPWEVFSQGRACTLPELKCEGKFH